jgi:outer membrane biogenesis lipoprotein LolB
VKRAATAALLLTAVACRTPVPAPAGGIARDAVALWAAWQVETSQRQSLRGRARLAVDRAGQALPARGKQVLVLERPGRLRVEILGLFSQTLAVLVTDGERFEIFRSADRSYDSGDVEPELLWREVGIALTPAEAVSVLLGAPPVPNEWRVADDQVVAEGERGDDLRWLTLADASGRSRQRVAFDRDGHLSVAERLGAAGDVLWRAGYADYRDVGGRPVAHEVTLDVTAGATRAELSLRNIELNPDLPPDIFRLRPGTISGAGSGEGG